MNGSLAGSRSAADSPRSRLTTQPIWAVGRKTGRWVDLDAAELTVDWQLQRIGKHLVRRGTKTEASDAVLPLPDICVVALGEHQARQKAAREAVGEAWQESPLIFTARYGTPLEPRNFNRFWDRRCDAAGVRRITVHDARRTCGMQILRHAQFSITMEIYTQVSSDQTREALKRLGESLDR